MIAGGLHAQAMALVLARLEAIGMTQAELARRMGWSAKHVNQIVNGKKEPSMASLDFMCHCIGLELSVEAK